MNDPYEYHAEQIIARPRDDVFSFFADAENLETLTPDYLSFEVTSETPITMEEGCEITYSLKLYGIPVTWISRIEIWDPPRKFVDVQVKGPYKDWHHEHRFEETDKGTNVIDHVKYDVPGWVFSPIIHAWFVRPDVESIFSYRREKLKSIFS